MQNSDAGGEVVDEDHCSSSSGAQSWRMSSSAKTAMIRPVETSISSLPENACRTPPLRIVSGLLGERQEVRRDRALEDQPEHARSRRPRQRRRARCISTPRLADQVLDAAAAEAGVEQQHDAEDHRAGREPAARRVAPSREVDAGDREHRRGRARRGAHDDGHRLRELGAGLPERLGVGRRRPPRRRRPPPRFRRAGPDAPSGRRPSCCGSISRSSRAPAASSPPSPGPAPRGGG